MRKTQERNEKRELYGRGYDLLKASLAEVPAEAMLFKPEPKEWSVYEVIIHIADSETNAALRARMLPRHARPWPVRRGAICPGVRLSPPSS